MSHQYDLFGNPSAQTPNPKPETIVGQVSQVNSDILAALVRIPSLSQGERYFIRTLVTHKNISRRQQESLDALRDKYLPKEGGWNDGIHGETVPRHRDPSDQL